MSPQTLSHHPNDFIHTTLKLVNVGMISKDSTTPKMAVQRPRNAYKPAGGPGDETRMRCCANIIYDCVGLGGPEGIRAGLKGKGKVKVIWG